ncbi:MAG: leucine-rich repeat protein [Bacilli bacterium]|nr:leucine-rich repeat protein [Bacilli bacterium]
MKKGFTLIELLAVIVILAVISIITAPIILDVIGKSHTGAYKATTYGLIDGANYYNINHEIDNDGKTFEIENGSFVGDALPVDGKLPDSASVALNDEGQVEVFAIYDNKCVYKEYDQVEVTLVDNALTCTAMSLLSGATNYITTNSLTEAEFVITDNSFVGDSYNAVGDLPDNAVIMIDNQNVSEWIIDDNEYFYQTFANDTLTETEDATEFVTYELIDGASYYVISNDLEGTETSFTITNSSFVGESYDTVGTLPDTADIVVNELEEVAIHAIYSDQCVYKDYTDSTLTYSDDLSACQTEVAIVPLDTAPESCFQMSGTTIVGYYTYEGNNSSNPLCPDNFAIPATVDGVTVTAIGGSAFTGDSITDVQIPEGIVDIAAWSFSSSGLESVTIPSTVTSIGYAAFYTNSIDSVYIENGVTTIGDYAFASNALTDIDLPDSVTSIGECSFQNNSITLLEIPSSLTTINNYAFYGNSIETLVIPEGVTTIGAAAFYNNPITSLTLSSTVTTIGDWAFQYAHMTTVSIPSSVTSLGGWSFGQEAATYPWSSVTIHGDGTNSSHRFDGVLASVGWEGVTINYITD